MNSPVLIGNRSERGARKMRQATKDLARSVLRLRETAKSNFGSSGPALNLMLALLAFDERLAGRHIGSVAERAHVPRSTALRWLRKLQQSGYVSLVGDRHDGRAVRVSMTSSGIETMQASFITARLIR